MSNRKWTSAADLDLLLYGKVLYTDSSVPNIRKLASVGPQEKCDRNFFVTNLSMSKIILSCVKQEVDIQSDLKLCYTIQIFILILCAKNQESWPAVVPEKNVTEFFCDQFVLWPNYSKLQSNRKWTCSRFETVLHNTVLHTDTLSVPSIRKLACVVPENL